MSKYHLMRSMKLAYRWVCRTLQLPAPRRSNMLRWERSFLESGNIGHIGGNVRQRESENPIQKGMDICQNDLTLSIHFAFVR